MQDVTGEPVDPSWAEPLWIDEKIFDVSLESAREWLRGELGVNRLVKKYLSQIRDEYERDRARLVARVDELERELAEAKQERYQALLRREFGDRSDK